VTGTYESDHVHTVQYMRTFGTADGDDLDIKTEGNNFVAYMWFHVSDEDATSTPPSS